jgi:hypothetical protein
VLQQYLLWIKENGEASQLFLGFKPNQKKLCCIPSVPPKKISKSKKSNSAPIT